MHEINKKASSHRVKIFNWSNLDLSSTGLFGPIIDEICHRSTERFNRGVDGCSKRIPGKETDNSTRPPWSSVPSIRIAPNSKHSQMTKTGQSGTENRSQELRNSHNNYRPEFHIIAQNSRIINPFPEHNVAAIYKEVVRSYSISCNHFKLVNLENNLLDSSTLAIHIESFLEGITFLDLSNNSISNLDSLRNLPSLSNLQVSHNRLEYFPPLTNFAQLKYLVLKNNFITNLQVSDSLAFGPFGSQAEPKAAMWKLRKSLHQHSDRSSSRVSYGDESTGSFDSTPFSPRIRRLGRPMVSGLKNHGVSMSLLDLRNNNLSNLVTTLKAISVATPHIEVLDLSGNPFGESNEESDSGASDDGMSRPMDMNFLRISTLRLRDCSISRMRLGEQYVVNRLELNDNNITCMSNIDLRECKYLDISRNSIFGELDISDFIGLQTFVCENNEVVSVKGIPPTLEALMMKNNLIPLIEALIPIAEIISRHSDVNCRERRVSLIPSLRVLDLTGNPLSDNTHWSQEQIRCFLGTFPKLDSLNLVKLRSLMKDISSDSSVTDNDHNGGIPVRVTNKESNVFHNNSQIELRSDTSGRGSNTSLESYKDPASVIGSPRGTEHTKSNNPNSSDNTDQDLAFIDLLSSNEVAIVTKSGANNMRSSSEVCHSNSPSNQMDYREFFLGSKIGEFCPSLATRDDSVSMSSHGTSLHGNPSSKVFDSDSRVFLSSTENSNRLLYGTPALQTTIQPHSYQITIHPESQIDTEGYESLDSFTLGHTPKVQSGNGVCRKYMDTLNEATSVESIEDASSTIQQNQAGESDWVPAKGANARRMRTGYGEDEIRITSHFMKGRMVVHTKTPSCNTRHFDDKSGHSYDLPNVLPEALRRDPPMSQLEVPPESKTTIRMFSPIITPTEDVDPKYHPHNSICLRDNKLSESPWIEKIPHELERHRTDELEQSKPKNEMVGGSDSLHKISGLFVTEKLCDNRTAEEFENSLNKKWLFRLWFSITAYHNIKVQLDMLFPTGRVSQKQLNRFLTEQYGETLTVSILRRLGYISPSPSIGNISRIVSRYLRYTGMEIGTEAWNSDYLQEGVTHMKILAKSKRMEHTKKGIGSLDTAHLNGHEKEGEISSMDLLVKASLFPCACHNLDNPEGTIENYRIVDLDRSSAEFKVLQDYLLCTSSHDQTSGTITRQDSIYITKIARCYSSVRSAEIKELIGHHAINSTHTQSSKAVPLIFYSNRSRELFGILNGDLDFPEHPVLYKCPLMLSRGEHSNTISKLSLRCPGKHRESDLTGNWNEKTRTSYDYSMCSPHKSRGRALVCILIPGNTISKSLREIATERLISTNGSSHAYPVFETLANIDCLKLSDVDAFVPFHGNRPKPTWIVEYSNNK